MNQKHTFPAQPDAYRKAATRLEKWLESCVLCPRRCQVNRLQGVPGFCGGAAHTARVSSAQLHFGEEPPISGSSGSGTVFFAGCTLACRFCQNYQISQRRQGEELGPEDLASVFLRLQLNGAHNLNFVTPTPHLVVILKALAIARENGCKLPVVYNTSGYERAAVIRQLAGLVEIYMPDYKYFSNKAASRLSDAPDYVQHCRAALKETYAQVGGLALDERGVAYRGVLVRHLVLPNRLSGTEELLPDLARIGGDQVWINLMAQYHPMYQASRTEGLKRRLTLEEFESAREALDQSGIRHGWVQGLSSTDGGYLPGYTL
jgi:putative pyruvate formate lyase activating enzyme